MSSFNLRRFSSPEALKAIAPAHLLAFLSRYQGFLAERGLQLPAADQAASLDYERLADLLMSPNEDTPQEMAEALYLVHEMATREGMDCLLAATKAAGLALDESPDIAPADLAIQVWMKDPVLLERQHAEQSTARPRSFEYFQADAASPKALDAVSTAKLQQLATALDDWFEMNLRGRGTRVFAFPRGEITWFLVRHGDLLKREGRMEKGQSSSFYYRPERYDVVVYDQALGEVRIHAGSNGETELYRRQFGSVLFGSADYFPGQAKYSLLPLVKHGRDALSHAEFPQIRSVQLVELQIAWGGTYREIETRRASDLFAVYERRRQHFPTGGRLVRATLQIRFRDSNSPRRLTIKPPNVVLFRRDSDGDLVEEWLRARGFITHEQEKVHAPEENDVALVGT